ncbi:MAG: HAD-IIIA family hydrolase [Paludibacteraceae bacterium]
MFKEIVILAGGFGTRLSHVLGNVPKPMAPVSGRPFLTYLLDRLEQAGAEHIILATGYLYEVVENYFGATYRSLRISYSREEQPLWTGGAIKAAMRFVDGDNFLVLNADTLFDINGEAFCRFHSAQERDISVALRSVADTARYGSVRLDKDQNRITGFSEKAESAGAGLINGGIYAIRKAWLQSLDLPTKFSFEKEVLQTMVQTARMYGMVFDNYFIDIGVPEDYYRAQREFIGLFPAEQFLFLDRDGVLNRRIEGGYVCNLSMWEWQKGALEAVAALSRRYLRTFVVSNQQGIGKGLFSMQDAAEIHGKMIVDIENAGGKIDRVYVCPDLVSADSPNRKPAIGMALQAKRDYPEVEFTRSLMIGDSLSDMQFGWRAGMRCIYLHNNEPIPDEVRDYTDICVPDLQAVSAIF